jgi:hypothetical protein
MWALDRIPRGQSLRDSRNGRVSELWQICPARRIAGRPGEAIGKEHLHLVAAGAHGPGRALISSVVDGLRTLRSPSVIIAPFWMAMLPHLHDFKGQLVPGP